MAEAAAAAALGRRKGLLSGDVCVWQRVCVCVCRVIFLIRFYMCVCIGL